MKKSLRAILCLLLLIVLLPKVILAGIPEVGLFMVTDVTTRSFSVIWAASEESTCSLEVYEDEEGLVALSGVVIESHPVESGDLQIQTAAEDNGVMKVRVTGLEPTTTYYFKTITTSKSTSDTTSYPELAPYLSVTTETQTVRTLATDENIVPFSNDVIVQPCYLDDDVTPAEGTLLIATVEGANYPLTAFVGDGVNLPEDALIDLNNVFGLSFHENIDLKQGENLTLLNFRGIRGNAIVTFEVPLDNSLTEVKPPAYSLKPGWNMVSVQLDPVNPDTASVLDPILNQVQSIWSWVYDDQSATWGWVSYDKDNPPFLNDLNELHSSVGYWINMTDASSLPVRNGTFIEDGVSLTMGWNLVGYTSIHTLPINEAISSISSLLNSIWTFDLQTSSWISYDKDNPPFLNTLDVIKPGMSYWVNVSEDLIWY